MAGDTAPGGGLARRALGLMPGVLLCAVVGVVAVGVARFEAGLLGRTWPEPLVLAILLGALIRLVWTPGEVWRPGIDLSAKGVLEVAVALLGATISAQALAAAGLPLLVGVAALVVAALFGGYAIGRALGLPHKMSLLVAAGNAICGNSAIVAVAPVIKAEPKDVAAAIGFTAVLGVAVVLILPVLGAWLALSAETYGVVAGLTVYAVPQVLAAAAPAGAAAVQVGTLVKLARVLALGPVVLGLGLYGSRLEGGPPPEARPKLGQLVPWFIVGFVGLLIVRSLGWIDDGLAAAISRAVMVLTVVAMAALGLGVDPKGLIKAGPRVAATASLTILLMMVLALLLAVALGGR